MSEKLRVIEHKGNRYPVVGESKTSYYVTQPYEEMDGDAWWVPKSEAKLIPDKETHPLPKMSHKGRMHEWRSQWNNGDTKFVSELLDYTDSLSRKLDNAADYGYRAEGRMKDQAKEIERLKGFEEWHTVAMTQFPEEHRVINNAWMNKK